MNEFPHKSAPRIVTLDEESRHAELFGEAFDELEIQPEAGRGRAPEEILGAKPDLILLSREWSYDWRLCAAAARRANIPVVYVMDGVLEWSYVWNNLSFVRGEGTVLQPLIASDLCVIGQHPARILAGLGLAPRIHVTGLARYDTFDRRRVVDAAAVPRIVITTARTCGHNAEQKIAVHQAVRDLKAWFGANSFVRPVWRIAAELAEETGVKPDANCTLAEQLQTANALISFPSTCALEGMLKGLPVAQMEYRPVPLYVAGAWEIRSPAHISGVIQELLYPPAERLAHQDACLADELEAGNASSRLARVIRRALNSPTPYQTGDQPCRILGQLDYRRIHSELSAFAAAPQSLLQYELDAALAAIKRVKSERADLQKLADERQQTIDQLDRLAREREDTICRLDAQLRRSHAPVHPSILTPV